MRLARSGPIPTARTHSSLSSSATMLVGAGASGGVAQPGETGAAQRGVRHEQAIERRLFGVGQAVHQGLECSFARPCPRSQPDPLQHGGVWDQHAFGVQVGEDGLHDRLAAVCRPGRFRTDPQAVAPVTEPEAAQAQDRLQLGGVLSAGLVAPSVIGEDLG